MMNGLERIGMCVAVVSNRVRAVKLSIMYLFGTY
jgi:hypothetical protein